MVTDLLCDIPLPLFYFCTTHRESALHSALHLAFHSVPACLCMLSAEYRQRWAILFLGCIVFLCKDTPRLM